VGFRQQPFAVWMLNNVGSFGVRRVAPERRGAITCVIAYCRHVFESQVPFDFEFQPDTALYCVEMTEKAFRSAGLALS
jgi:hypothetical protein